MHTGRVTEYVKVLAKHVFRNTVYVCMYTQNTCIHTHTHTHCGLVSC